MSFGTLIRTHPARVAVTALRLRDAERALDRAQHLGPIQGWHQRAHQGFVPRIQALENENEYLITAELPGVEASDLQVVAEDGVLALTGLRKGAGWSEDLSDEEKDEHSVRFVRRIRFNGEIDEPSVSARYRNGLLTVTVPKLEPPKPEVRTIPVEVD